MPSDATAPHTTVHVLTPSGQVTTSTAIAGSSPDEHCAAAMAAVPGKAGSGAGYAARPLGAGGAWHKSQISARIIFLTFLLANALHREPNAFAHQRKPDEVLEAQ